MGKKKKKGFLMWVIILPLLLLMGFSGWKLYGILAGYKQARETYAAVQTQVLSTSRPTVRPAPASEAAIPTGPELPVVDWDALLVINPEVIGWVYVDGESMINYPLLQTDNNSDYLTTTVYGGYSVNGSLFAHCNSGPIVFPGTHLIIFGHNMKDGSMFGTLKYFAKDTYREEHHIYLLTPDQNYEVLPFCTATVYAFEKYYPVDFADMTAEEEYLSLIASCASWVDWSAVDLDYPLCTLSTCNGTYDQRFIVQGFLRPVP